MAQVSDAESLQSDFSLNLHAFGPAETTPATRTLNETLIEKCKSDVKWWQCGAAEYRQRRAAGTTSFPNPVVLDSASTFEVPSKAGDYNIPCRVFQPQARSARGVLYHIHGGGWVLGSSAGQDLLLHEISTKTDLVVLSVDYRLAPEHPFPAALDDCNEVAEWLIRNARSEWKCDLKFVGGESGGGTLASLVRIHLRDAGLDDTIAGTFLNYGCFDLCISPSVRALDPLKPLILGLQDTIRFIDAYIPGMTDEQKRNPRVSPVYNELSSLGSALFIVGTQDGLTDDTILMAGRWQLAGNSAIVKFIPGACHGFMTFDGSKVEATRQGWDMLIRYLNAN